MKRSLRDFLLTLIIAVVIFAVVAVFLVSFVENLFGDVVDKVGFAGEKNEEQTSQTAPATQAGAIPEEQEDRIVNFLVIGTDRNGKADSLFLIGINATQKNATCALIPARGYDNVNGVKTSLADLYASEGVGYISKFVETETKIKADYTCAVTMDALSNLIDFMGGITFAVPENIQYTDEEQGIKVNLGAGSQKLNGQQAVGMLYYNDYKNGKTGKEDTQLSFMKTLLSSFFREENRTRFGEIFYNVTANMKTDFTASDFVTWGDALFGFSSYSSEFSRIPGAVGSDGFYAISTTRATSLFSAYKH